MPSHRELAMGLDNLRSEIAFMRLQVSRQRKEILLLQRAGIPTTSAETLLQRMLDKIDGLCAQRDRLKAELPKPKGKVLGGRKWLSTSKTIPTRRPSSRRWPKSAT
jgi:hypothetical protein